MGIDSIKEDYLRKQKQRRLKVLNHEVFNLKISIKDQERLKKYLQENTKAPLKFIRKDKRLFIYSNKENELKVRRFIFNQILKLEKEFNFDSFELKCDNL